MDLFEQGRLKGQKLSLSSLISKPQFKQQYLTPIRTLSQADQMSILQKVIDKQITILEVKKVASDLKCISGLKLAFLKLTNCELWDIASELYPPYATEAQLKRFTGINLKIGIPNSFQEFCRRAKSTTESTQSDREEALFTICKSGIPLTVNILRARFTEVSGARIQSRQPAFSGIDLGIFTIGNEVLF